MHSLGSPGVADKVGVHHVEPGTGRLWGGTRWDPFADRSDGSEQWNED